MTYAAGRNIATIGRSRLKPLLAALAGCGLALGSGAWGATFTVSSAADSGPGSLRQAVLDANASAGHDTVLFNLGLPAVVGLTSGQITVTESVTLEGPGNNGITISGNHLGRIFDVVDAADDNNYVTLTLTGLTLRDGRVNGENGGCVRSENASEEGTVVLDNSIVTGCRAVGTQGTGTVVGGLGGGIFSDGLGASKYDGASVIARNSTIAGNSATIAGGGAFGYLTQLEASVVTGNTLTGGSFDLGDNQTKYGLSIGAGVAAFAADIRSSTISGNTALTLNRSSGPEGSIGAGGGIGAFVLGLTNSTVSGNTLRPTAGNVDNYAYLLGGGVASLAGAVIVNSTISGNAATGTPASGPGAPYAVVSGGGVFTTTAKYGLAVQNSTIAGNSVTGSSAPDAVNFLSAGGLGMLGLGPGPGAATAMHKATGGRDVLAAVAATLRDRIAAKGIGLPSQPSAPGDMILDSTIAANSTGAEDIGCLTIGPPCGQALAGANNLVETVAGGIILPGDTLNADPNLGPLADNGGSVAGAAGGVGTGPVRTHALNPGSPALDAGNNGAELDHDQRGPGYPRIKGSGPDIGAMEGTATVGVPALGPWSTGLLGTLVGLAGLFSRTRRRDT
jgi:hypothetical protein